MSKWIRTEDKRPKAGKMVLAYWSKEHGHHFDGSMEVCCWRRKGWLMSKAYRSSHFDDPVPYAPTHWMELPAVPPGSENE